MKKSLNCLWIVQNRLYFRRFHNLFHFVKIASQDTSTLRIPGSVGNFSGNRQKNALTVSGKGNGDSSRGRGSSGRCKHCYKRCYSGYKYRRRDGKYSISVPNQDAVLVFSFIGYTVPRCRLQVKLLLTWRLYPSYKTLRKL